jgi:hypothetical protein
MAENASKALYDIHGLLRLSIDGDSPEVASVLDQTLSPFKVQSGAEDVAISLNTFPSEGWKADGLTVGDRLLYNFEQDQTTVFKTSTGIHPNKDDVEYVITGDVRNAGAPARIDVPHLSKPSGRLRDGLRNLARSNWKVAALTLWGDPLFANKHYESQASRIRLAVLEPLLYFRLPSKGCTLLHASALSLNGSGILIAGSGHVGKTTLALQLAKRGFAYLGDDLSILRDDGQILSYPEPIRIEKQHLRLFPSLREKAFSGAGGLGRMLLRNVSENSSEELLNYLPRRRVTEIFDGVVVGDAYKLESIIMLRRGLGKESTVQEIDEITLAKILGAELFWEFAAAPWRHSQYAYCSSCAKAEDFIAEEAQLHSRILEVIRRGISGSKAHVITEPIDLDPTELEKTVLEII